MARHRDEPEEEEDQEMDEDLVTLQFDEPLSWRAGKPIATGELLRRLEKLSKELVDLDQETIDKQSLTAVAKDLAAHNLLAHKEHGVKAFVAACLVDILKLCAPEAPFTPKQLKEIFTLFVKVILPALWDPTNAYNTQHKYVLTSLAEVKSILLINEVTNAEDLLLQLFSSFFDGISGSSKSTSGEQVAKDIEFHMTDILVTLVDESASLPPSVLDVIMAQFLRAAPPGGHKADVNGNQTTLLPKEEPEAYVMAKTVCNSCPDRMARYVGQYFSDVIMDVSGAAAHANGHKGDGDDSDDENGPSGPSETDFRELRKAHLLLRELWRAAPTVLQNVVPQVDAELSADNLSLRLLATETLGDLISGIGAAGPPPLPALDPAAYPPLKLNDDSPEQSSASILTTPISPLSFAQTHSQAFHNFVSRKNDKSPLIRAAWTTAVGYIVSTSAGGIGLSREDESVFINGLRDKLNDNDEKVRLAAVKAIESFEFRDIIMKLASLGGISKEGSVLFTLADRCRDRRPAVRVEAMALLGKLWAVASGEIAAGQEAVITALSGVPSRILSTFYANDLELNVLLERVLFECLVPLSFPPPPKAKASKASQSQSQQSTESTYDPDRVRAERVLVLVKGLDAGARKAFNALQARQPQFSKVIENLVRQCELWNGGNPDGNADAIKQNLKKTIAYLGQFLPDPVKVDADLHNYASWHDRRSYQLIKFAVSPESDFKTMHRAVKEFVKRVQGSPKPHMLETLLPLLYRSAYIIFNKSHLSAFMDCSKSDKDGLGAAAQEVTTEISQHNPDLFKAHVGQLCKDLLESAPTADKPNDAAVVETLKACSSYSRKYPTELPNDRKFTQALMSYALHGQPAKTAKYAVNVMMARKDEKSMVSATDLLQRITKSWGYDKPHFLSKLVAVSQLELLASKVTADANDEIVEMAFKNVLSKVRTPAKESDPEWVPDSELGEECQIKCWALNLVVNRIRGVKAVDEAKELAPPVFKLLRSLIKQQGELCKSADTPPHHKTRLRLLAGQLFLKLCTSRHLEELFSHADFNQLALLTQDGCAMVRRGFVEKLQKYLVQNRLRPRFYTIIFLTAFEPQADFKAGIETWIRSRARFFRDAKQNVMESTMGRLISLLAHHPDYSPETADLLDHARYLLYYVSNVTTENNFGMIFKYAERVKQTIDGLTPSQSDNLYVLSDLAQTILRKWQERKNWSFQAYAGKVGLPLGLYSALPSHQAAQEIAEKQYLPDGMDGLVDDLVRSVDKKKKRKSADERADGQPANKRTKAAQRPMAAKPKSASTTKSSAKKTARPKAPAKPKKTVVSRSSISDADRRRSGRSRKDTSYMERDDDLDEEDMLEGVAEWDYYDSDGNVIQQEDEDESGQSDQPDEDEPEAEAEVEAVAEDMDEDDGEEDKPEPDPEPAPAPIEPDDSELSDVEDEAEVEEEEAVPLPTKNSRRGRKTAPAAPKEKNLPSRPAAAAKGKAAASSKAKPKPKPTPPAKPTRSTRATRSRKAVEDDDEGSE